MIKKSIIAIALVAFLAGTVQAADPYIKQDWNQIWIAWPYEYKALTLCVVPVYMNVGNYVQLKECHKRKIELKQVDCEGLPDDVLGTEDPAKFFPCYHDCDTLEIKSNFEVKLGAKLTKIGPVLKDTRIYYSPDDVTGPSADWEKTDLCMWAWKAEIWKVGAQKDAHVGDIEVTVKPNA